MGNIALNKTATASSFVMPYTAVYVVNGATTPFSRWLCNTLPGWINVDLGASYLVNQWVIKHMSVAGWATNYANSDFKLQGSNDNSNWFDIDFVTGNTGSTTSRTITPSSARYFRTFFTKGLNVNTPFASVMEFELYQAYSSILTNLVISGGALTPVFNPNTLAYTATVDANVASINITPTAKDPQAIIKINNVVSPTGQPKSVNLNYGANNIVVNVTAGDGSQNNYTIAVTRQGNANLNTLIVKDNSSAIVPLNPAFDKATLSYTAKTDVNASSVTVTPTVEDPQATVKVNGTTVISGQPSAAITIGAGVTISVEVTATTGNKQTYTIQASKGSAAYLSDFKVKQGMSYPAFSPVFSRDYVGPYALNVQATTSVTIYITVEGSSTAVVKCNGTPLTLSGTGYPLSMPTAGTYSIVVTVTASATDKKDYTLNITRS
jgi:hypothetical protein